MLKVWESTFLLKPLPPPESVLYTRENSDILDTLMNNEVSQIMK